MGLYLNESPLMIVPRLLTSIMLTIFTVILQENITPKHVIATDFSYYGPQANERELLLSDIYDFRISGAYVEEPLLLQIPVYSRAEQYEDVFVKTDKGIYNTPVRIARMVDANKVDLPHCVTSCSRDTSFRIRENDGCRKQASSVLE